MSQLAKKVATARRVVREQGWKGIGTLFGEKIRWRRFVQPPADYTRLLPSALMQLARHGRPKLFINAIGAGIGDDLLCTAILRELAIRNIAPVWITTRYPQLFERNDDVRAVVAPLDRYDILVKRLGANVVYPWYTSYNPAFDRDEPIPEQHIISVMCQKAGITGTVTLKPYLTLSHAELREGRIGTRQIAIQSSGLSARHSMMNKNWSASGYQSVVDQLKDEYTFVQIGSLADAPLSGVIDLRGQTDLRTTAAVLAGSLTFVGQVGLLMHLARAVECRSVIVYGGRETPAQSGYSCNENLYAAVPCSPCWKLNACPHDRMCLSLVRADEVVEAVELQVSRHRAPLALDQVDITPELIVRNSDRHEHAVAAHQAAWVALYQ